MNLKKWLSLADAERDRLKQDWDPKGSFGYWPALLEEARKSFEEEHGHVPQILYVTKSCQFDEQNPPHIYVATILPKEQKLGELPDIYATFPVQQEGLRQDVDAFLNTWVTVLKEIGGLSDAYAKQWAQEQDYVFRSGWFLHDPPLRFVTGALLPGWVCGSERMKLSEEIEGAITMGLTEWFYPDQDPRMDWQAAKARVQKILQGIDSSRG